MIRFRRILLPFLLSVLAFAPAEAQRLIGVQWELPGGLEEAGRQLRTFDRLGIEIVEIDRPPEPALWDSLRRAGMEVWAAVPVRYPTYRTFAEPDSLFLSTMERHLERYIAREQVGAIRLFAWGAVHDPRFTEALSPYTAQIRELFAGGIYYLRSGRGQAGGTDLLDFAMRTISVRPGWPRNRPPDIPEGAGAWLYRPSPEMSTLLGPLKQVLDATADSPETPLFLPSNWLLENIARYPSLGNTLRLHATEEQAVFPLPEESYPTEDQVGLGVLLLFLLWGSVALNYSLSPLYRRSAGRFFTSHRFYVNDVLHRHVRAPGQGVVMLVQHSLLSGILLYSLGRFLFSPAGMNALTHHLPAMEILGGPYLSLFCWGFLLSLLVELVSILWLLVVNRKIDFFSQVTNLYNWPLQLNLVTVTVLFTLLISGTGTGWAVSLLLGVYGLVLFGSFLLTAYDTSGLVPRRFVFLLATAGIYLLLLSALTAWIVSYTEFPTVLSLALHL